MKNIDWQLRAKNSNLYVRNHINGEATVCLGNDTIEKYSPRDGSLLYSFQAGTGEEVKQAVSCAKKSFRDGRWCKLPIVERKRILGNLADLIESRREEFVLYECLDVGKVLSQSYEDVEISVAVLRENIESVDKLHYPSTADAATFAIKLHKPIGVVGAIIGWNFPLFLAVQKLAPALIMGNSLVLKPSEFTPLSAGLLAELAVEAGIPPGVFNVINGTGNVVGSRLAHNSDVNLLSFTGSSATGKQMMIAAGQSNMKRLLLECGGKAPYIVFEDCPNNLDFVAADIVHSAFRNQGQVCIAGSRLVVQENIKEELLVKVLEHTEKLTPQDPLDPNARFGPLMSESHMQKVLSYINIGQQQGADLIVGGKRINVNVGDSSSQGCFLEPTIFDNVNPQDKIAQEEIFGPVLSITSFNNEQEAIEIANSTCYGLAAYAATENMSRAHRLSQQIDAGFVIVTGSSTPSGSPAALGLDPHRESGFGQEGSLSGLLAYTVSTTAYLLG